MFGLKGFCLFPPRFHLANVHPSDTVEMTDRSTGELLQSFSIKIRNEVLFVKRRFANRKVYLSLIPGPGMTTDQRRETDEFPSEVIEPEFYYEGSQ